MAMIDTLEMYKKLKAAGIKARQAEAITKAIAFAHTARSNDLQAKKEAEVRTGFPREVK
jgi:hypothetical protein